VAVVRSARFGGQLLREGCRGSRTGGRAVFAGADDCRERAERGWLVGVRAFGPQRRAHRRPTDLARREPPGHRDQQRRPFWGGVGHQAAKPAVPARAAGHGRAARGWFSRRRRADLQPDAAALQRLAPDGELRGQAPQHPTPTPSRRWSGAELHSDPVRGRVAVDGCPRGGRRQRLRDVGGNARYRGDLLHVGTRLEVGHRHVGPPAQHQRRQRKRGRHLAVGWRLPSRLLEHCDLHGLCRLPGQQSDWNCHDHHHLAMGPSCRPVPARPPLRSSCAHRKAASHRSAGRYTTRSLVGNDRNAATTVRGTRCQCARRCVLSRA
jgi:hypothetical protein